MAEAQDILQYIPVSFKSPSEQEYIEFLWDAFEHNYKSDKYQFAFFAYHMLFMSCVYFNIWQLKQTRANDFKTGLLGYEKASELLKATSPFTFSQEQESKMVRFMQLLGCDDAKLGTYKKIIRERNEIAHTNGNISFKSKDSLDAKINEIVRIVDEIQTHSAPIINEIFKDFLETSWDIDNREYSDELDEVREVLIHSNYMSFKDIEQMLSFDMTSINSAPNYKEKQQLFDVLKENYS
ncbi:MAG TPA: hypothetical protein VK167_02310 [Flavipsychrobacter sp.]|nr:hypothetical protein [Flavipsychrobacter sp.]